MENLTDIYHQLNRQILRFLLKRNGGDLDAAQVVLQDTFVAAFKSFKTFRHKSSYFTWLCKISLNKLADYYRDQVHRKSKIIVPTLNQFNLILDPSLTPEESLSLEELKRSVNACLDLLPPEHRQLLHLRYYQQLSGQEICVKLNLSPRQLEGRLYRARNSLAKIVATRYPNTKL